MVTNLKPQEDDNRDYTNTIWNLIYDPIYRDCIALESGWADPLNFFEVIACIPGLYTRRRDIISAEIDQILLENDNYLLLEQVSDESQSYRPLFLLV